MRLSQYSSKEKLQVHFVCRRDSFGGGKFCGRIADCVQLLNDVSLSFMKRGMERVGMATSRLLKPFCNSAKPNQFTLLPDRSIFQ